MRFVRLLLIRAKITNPIDFFLKVVAEGIIKGRFLQRGRRGSVPNAELFELLGIEESSQSLNKKASMQKKMEAELAKVTPATLVK